MVAGANCVFRNDKATTTCTTTNVPTAVHVRGVKGLDLATSYSRSIVPGGRARAVVAILGLAGYGNSSDEDGMSEDDPATRVGN